MTEKQTGVAKGCVTLSVESPDFDPPGMSTIWHAGAVAGEVTTGVWRRRVAACLALGRIRADPARAGTRVEVEIFGTRSPVTVQPEGPLWDPGNERPRR